MSDRTKTTTNGKPPPGMSRKDAIMLEFVAGKIEEIKNRPVPPVTTVPQINLAVDMDNVVHGFQAQLAKMSSTFSDALSGAMLSLTEQTTAFMAKLSSTEIPAPVVNVTVEIPGMAAAIERLAKAVEGNGELLRVIVDKIGEKRKFPTLVIEDKKGGTREITQKKS